jgi:hypothetical protein
MSHPLVKKRKPVRGLLVALPLIVAYFLLFPHPLGREVVLRARWRVALPAEGAPVAGNARTVAASGLAPFQLGDLYGFVSPDGALASLERTPFRVTLSRRGAVAFARVGGTWVLDGPSGQALETFSGDGYPSLSREDGSHGPARDRRGGRAGVDPGFPLDAHVARHGGRLDRRGDA